MRELIPLVPGPLTLREVVGRRAMGGLVPVCGALSVTANGSTGSVWRGAGVRSVHVVHGFPRNLGTA